MVCMLGDVRKPQKEYTPLWILMEMINELFRFLGKMSIRFTSSKLFYMVHVVVSLFISYIFIITCDWLFLCGCQFMRHINTWTDRGRERNIHLHISKYGMTEPSSLAAFGKWYQYRFWFCIISKLLYTGYLVQTEF